LFELKGGWCLTINIEALTKQLVSMRAQIDAALFLLHVERPCQHEQKLVLTVMGGKEEWTCKKCQFHFKEE
jgi:hypothetical protein